MQSNRVLRRKDVVAKVGLSGPTIWRMERRGDFPKHWMLTPTCSVWDESAIDAWLESRRAAQVAPLRAPDIVKAREASREAARVKRESKQGAAA